MAKKSSYFFSNYRERLSLFIPFHFILSHSNQNIIHLYVSKFHSLLDFLEMASLFSRSQKILISFHTTPQAHNGFNRINICFIHEIFSYFQQKIVHILLELLIKN